MFKTFFVLYVSFIMYVRFAYKPGLQVK